MKKVHVASWILMIIFSCSKDDLKAGLESIEYSCCDSNPFDNVNVNNLDQSRGEIAFFGFVSPNNDGINDFWTIRNLDLYENFNLQIFDLNEKIVFQADNSNTESIVFFPQNGEFEDRDRVLRYKLVIEDESIYLNQGYFCLFTGTSKRSAGKCSSVFPDPIFD
ncbi:gliding motility-associated C-terminal domain-containing protein [Cellulophaga baltica]|uniref:gliding motility-associated C-terminal domain-containing protein n=1 Tax=Cellulophaga baltica TaxID=76594 RepID=UPI0021473B31|nr:gliding motility-associated C-terminal domain-containing protein [Cellulophaga baltica]MCR1026109.1 gliding motility-associated C-terminal domain-containing protein [Cellulophaga baltica]